jgi:hypothetical protein
LFVSDLLELKNGAAKLRAMLQMLPRCYNWQTRFKTRSAENFPRRSTGKMVGAANRELSPRTTPVRMDARRQPRQLDEILSVPVEMRVRANSLPVHAEISLQAVIRNFDSAQQTVILQAKLRDLELAQLAHGPQLAVLTDAYRHALADYLGERKSSALRRPEKHTRRQKIQRARRF